MYFLYRHIRLDKNEVFYIGIGTIVKTKYNTFSIKTLYRRAFDEKKSRSIYWKNIINKTDYKVEIIFETENIKLINNKEKEFIKLYGREDLGLGTLCNLTNGGEGVESYKHKQITKDKIKNTMKGRKLSKEHAININKRKFKKIVMYNDTLSLFFDSLTDAAKYLNIKDIGNISSCLLGKRKQAYGYKFKYN